MCVWTHHCSACDYTHSKHTLDIGAHIQCKHIKHKHLEMQLHTHKHTPPPTHAPPPPTHTHSCWRVSYFDLKSKPMKTFEGSKWKSSSFFFRAAAQINMNWRVSVEHINTTTSLLSFSTVSVISTIKHGVEKTESCSFLNCVDPNHTQETALLKGT